MQIMLPLYRIYLCYDTHEITIKIYYLYYLAMVTMLRYGIYYLTKRTVVPTYLPTHLIKT